MTETTNNDSNLVAGRGIAFKDDRDNRNSGSSFASEPSRIESPLMLLVFSILLAALSALAAWPAITELSDRVRFNSVAVLTSGAIEGSKCDQLLVEELGVVIDRGRDIDSDACWGYQGKRLPVVYDPENPDDVISGWKKSYADLWVVSLLLFACALVIGAAVLFSIAATAPKSAVIRRLSIAIALVPLTAVSAIIAWITLVNLSSVQNFNSNATHHVAKSEVITQTTWYSDAYYGGGRYYACYRYLEVEDLGIGFVKVTGADPDECGPQIRAVRSDPSLPRDLIIGTRKTELWPVVFLATSASLFTGLSLGILKLLFGGLGGRIRSLGGTK